MRHLYNREKVRIDAKWLKEGRYGVWLLFTLFLFISHHSLRAQTGLAITNNSNAQSLTQMLAGTGVTISNYTKNCDANATGTFVNTGTNLGISQGVVLSTGRVSSIGQSVFNLGSSSFTGSGDAELATLTGGTINDKCVLEFDIIPQGSVLKFDYVFASEEYPEFVCSNYNDVFGFFISGPNPLGGSYTNKNMATIPGTNTPVCINSVNPGTPGTYMGNTWNSMGCSSLSYPNLYVDNRLINNQYNVYDGMTTVMTAQADVTPCQTYHLKIAIADISDRIYDSGVFLQAYSFTSTPYSLDITSKISYPGYTSTYEGCVNGSFDISISSAQGTPITINLTPGGTATAGVDYTALPNSVTIPAGQTTVNVPFTVFQDNTVEGTETIILSAINVCTGTPGTSDTVTIQDISATSLLVGDSTLCSGQSTQLTASGAYSYAWSPATGLSSTSIANPTASPTVTTTYTVTMTAGSCVNTASRTIYASNPAVTISSSPSGTVCNGATVQLTANPTGGANPTTFAWSNSGNTATTTVSTSGNYSVTTTDAYGCSASASVAKTISNLSVSGTATDVTCFGLNNGTITMNVTGLNTPFTYNWGGGITTQNRTGLAAGTYTVTVSNGAGCTATASYSITQPSAALSTSATSNNVACSGGNTGSINLTVTGGTTPYTFAWSNSATTEDISGLAAATYVVTVTDAKNCTETRSTTISQSGTLTISETHTNINCFGGTNGSIQLTVTGGASPYTYAWSNSATTQNLSGLAANTYTATVTDGNSCSTTKTVSLTQPTALTASASATSPACSGGAAGSITLTVGGGTPGYTYTWSNSATTQNLSNLSSGTFNVTVTDTRSCTATSSATISLSSALNLSAITTDVNCFGVNNGSITLSVSGGATPYSFNWGGGVTTQNRTNISGGTYTVTVTDANSCSSILTRTISQPAAALSVVASETQILCFGANNGAINLTATGGTTPYSFNWGGGVTTQNRSNLVAGSYQVTVTDGNSCSATSASTITQPGSGLTVSKTITNESCFGNNDGAVNLTVSGGTTPYSYAWTGTTAGQNAIGLTAGNYSVTVTDGNSCSASTTATVGQNSSIVVGATTTNVNCYGAATGSITLSVSGGTSPYTFNWGGGITTQNRTNITGGSYSVTVSDMSGCGTTFSATITQPASALSVSANVTNVVCFGGTNGQITTTVTGGTSSYTYNWAGGITTANRSNLGAGTYPLTVTDANLCSVTASPVITQPGSALFITASATDVSCYGGNNGSVSVAPTGGTTPYTYAWTGSATTQTVANRAAGNYTVTVTDANTCSTSATTTVSQPAVFVTSLSATNVTCNGGNTGSITSSVTGGTGPFSYLWSGGGTASNKTNLTAGIYSLTVTDAQSCQATASATITQPTGMVISKTITNITCNGTSTGAINIQVTGGSTPYQFNWADGATTQSRTSLTAGNYSLIVTDGNTCSATTTAQVTEPASGLLVNYTTTDVSCFGGSNGTANLTVTGGTSPYTFNWGNGITTQNITGLPQGTYNVTTTDANSCSMLKTITINQPASGMTATANQTNVKCYGGNDGTVSLTVTGGTSPYSFNWNNGATTQDRTSLTAGTYAVTVTDSKLCSQVVSSVVGQPMGLSVSSYQGDVSCYGQGDGNITVTVNGGVVPYSYKWSNYHVEPNITNLGAGTYTVTITDANSCTTTFAATINEPTQLQMTVTPTHVKCFGEATGSISTSVTGGTSTYTYLWNDNSTAGNLSNLVAGSYAVSVRDANQCITSATVNILEPEQIDMSAALTQPVCTNGVGDISVTVTGGTTPFTFNWTNGATTQDLNHVFAGTYGLTISDANNCSSTSSFELINQDAFHVTASGGGTIKLGESVELNAVATGSSQTTFDWMPSTNVECSSCANTSARPLQSTLFTVVATDINGCVASDTVSVIINEDYSLFIPNVFTPNSDGNNDYFQIYGNLESIRNISMNIYDRWGEVVFSSENPNFQWDGYYKGERALPGVYAYTLKATHINGHSEKLLKGTLTILK